MPRMPSLQHVWISSGLTRCLVPTPVLTSKYLTHAVFVCVHTRTHSTYTSSPCKNWGDTFTSSGPNGFLTLETSANHKIAGNPLLPSLFYIRMQWRLKHLWTVPKTPVDHTYAQRRWPPQDESKWWVQRQAEQQRLAETDANVDGLAMHFSPRFGSKQACRAPPFLHPTSSAGGYMLAGQHHSCNYAIGRCKCICFLMALSKKAHGLRWVGEKEREEIYIYIYTHTHWHIYTYIYIYTHTWIRIYYVLYTSWLVLWTAPRFVGAVVVTRTARPLALNDRCNSRCVAVFCSMVQPLPRRALGVWKLTDSRPDAKSRSFSLSVFLLRQNSWLSHFCPQFDSPWICISLTWTSSGYSFPEIKTNFFKSTSQRGSRMLSCFPDSYWSIWLLTKILFRTLSKTAIFVDL